MKLSISINTFQSNGMKADASIRESTPQGDQVLLDLRHVDVKAAIEAVHSTLKAAL